MEDEQTSTKSEVHSRITDAIISAIEAGVSDCEMPWHGRSGAGFPRNPATGNMYHGINTLSLWATSRLQGYGLPYWATYRQWKTLGANVRKGEHGSSIVFYKRDANTSDETQEERDPKDRTKLLLRYSTVFNAEQVEGWEQPSTSGSAVVAGLERAETFVKALAADVRYGSDSAYYSLKYDRIYMPNWNTFVDTKSGSAAESFYSVLFHEHVHWSGHASRLKRNLSGRFGSNAYAVEELVAELGAAFLCATFGVSNQPRDDHASYIANWLQVFGKQKSAILVAASAASTACRYLKDLSAHNMVAVA